MSRFLLACITLLFLQAAYSATKTLYVWRAEPIILDRDALVQKFIGEYYSLNVVTNGSVITWRYTSPEMTRLEWMSDGRLRVIVYQNSNGSAPSTLSNFLNIFLKKLGILDEMSANEFDWKFSTNQLFEVCITKYWQGKEVINGDRIALRAIETSDRTSNYEYFFNWYKVISNVQLTTDEYLPYLNTNNCIYQNRHYWILK